MTRVANRSFTAEFEILLARTWETQLNVLNRRYLRKTREAIATIREFYTFKKRMPSKINYKFQKYRAGYLASFGQRHAYLPYYQLRDISNNFSSLIPKPTQGELTLTLIGGAAAVETFGILYFFNERTQAIRKLNIINIEKIVEWDEVRSLYINTLIKDFFRKVNIREFPVRVDLRTQCAISFAEFHEEILNTDILMCYNVLNENEVKDQQRIIDNLRYILLLNRKPMLVLLMEPAPSKSIVRVRPFKKYLALICRILQDGIKTYVLDSNPLKIEFEPDDTEGLNRKLFERLPGETYNPIFYSDIKRIAFAAVKKPEEPLSKDAVFSQLKEMRDRQKGHFVRRRNVPQQTNFWS